MTIMKKLLTVAVVVTASLVAAVSPAGAAGKAAKNDGPKVVKNGASTVTYSSSVRPVTIPRPELVGTDNATLLPVAGSVSAPFSIDETGRLAVAADVHDASITLGLAISSAPPGMRYLVKLRRAGDLSTGSNTGFSVWIDSGATSTSRSTRFTFEAGTYEVVVIAVWVSSEGGDTSAQSASLNLG
jgi:hypothetical protein